MLSMMSESDCVKFIESLTMRELQGVARRLVSIVRYQSNHDCSRSAPLFDWRGWIAKILNLLRGAYPFTQTLSSKPWLPHFKSKAKSSI